MSAARPFVHAARAQLEPGGDPAALGGAVTVGLCGSWEHDGPCLWPHHSSTSMDGAATTVRTVFRAKPAHEREVRRLVDAALAVGRLTGPDGSETGWQILGSGRVAPTAEESSFGEEPGALPG